MFQSRGKRGPIPGPPAPSVGGPSLDATVLRGASLRPSLAGPDVLADVGKYRHAGRADCKEFYPARAGGASRGPRFLQTGEGVVRMTHASPGHTTRFRCARSGRDRAAGPPAFAGERGRVPIDAARRGGPASLPRHGISVQVFSDGASETEPSRDRSASRPLRIRLQRKRPTCHSSFWNGVSHSWRLPSPPSAT